MEKLFAITRSDGTLSIMNVVDDANMEKVIKDFNAINELKITIDDLKPITRDVIPTDRYFRNAWKHENGSINVDMKKAREIHINQLRLMRNTKLEELDKSYMKAIERDDSIQKENIATMKQQLRDMPQTFDLSVYKTPDQLKSSKPDYL